MPDSSGATVLDDLPESIIVEEILVRLPAKDVLRCRAVRTSWRGATSAHKFMLDHHLRQPSLPILHLPDASREEGRHVVFRGDGARASWRQKLCPILRYNKYNYGSLHVEAVCDGILIVCHRSKFYICNPAIRKCAPLPEPLFGKGIMVHVVGFYQHHPSGEYRVLWVSRRVLKADNSDIYILKVGSDKPRRIKPLSSVEHPLLKQFSYDPPVYHRRSLHWDIGRDGILVFDTAVETFRWMCRPSWPGHWESLFDMEGTLAFCGTINCLDIDVWVIQDYEAETWAFMCHINLSAVAASLPPSSRIVPKVAALNKRELLIQFRPRHLLRCDARGKFLGDVEVEGDKDDNVWLTSHCLQESIMPLLPFHETQEVDGASKEAPFFIGL